MNISHTPTGPNATARAIVAVMALLLAANSSSLLAAPRIDNLGPHGLQRGQETIVHVYGVELLDPQDVIFYASGIELVELEAHSDRHVAVRVRVAEDFPPGIATFRLCTGRGVSNMRSLGISDFPIVEEKEPNNATDQAELVTLPCTYHGRMQSEDVENVAVELEEGQCISLEVVGLRVGRELFDPHLSIFGPDGTELLAADDNVVTRYDPFCFFQAPSKGRYTIQIRDMRYYGNDLYLYLIHIGNFPRPSYAWPPGGRPGEELDIRWLTPGQPDWTQRVTLPSDESAYHAVAPFRVIHARNEQGMAPTPNQVRVIDLPSFAEIEPNDQPDKGTLMQVPGVAYGVIEKQGDVDFFRFEAKKGHPLEVEVFARRSLRSPLDAWLQIRDANNKQVLAVDDTGSPDCFADFNPPADGEYRLLIRDHLRGGGPTYVYRVELSVRTPRLALRTPDRQQFVSTTLNLPRGGRMALLVLAQKRHFNEAIELSFENLPAGVSVVTPIIPKGRDRVPVLFQTEPTTVRGGQLVSITGKARVGEQDIHGKFHQRTILVRGRNNRDVWGHDAQRLAVAIKDEAPFSIDIVEPHVPIVRNGSMELKIVAHRQEGFQAPIPVRMMVNPPGVYSRAVTIPEGKNEINMTLTANGSAGLAVFPIVVMGSASHDGAPFEVSSQLVDLAVEDSYFKVEFAKASVEQGSTSQLVVKLERKREFEGTTRAELLGLPAGTSSQPMEVAAETTELVFPIAADAKARVGRHNTVICRLTVTQNGEPVTHNLGTGQLRVDVPLPPEKQDATDPPSVPVAKT